MNVLDAQVFYELGVKRIIAARELSLKDAIEIKKALPDLELEIFVHGSMCFAFSGRCLISSLQNGRVPNRGSCANDCRFDYEYYVRNEVNDELVRFGGKEIYVRNPDNGVIMRLEEEESIGTHIFNAKDLNLISYLPMILESGAVDSLKIEGRTKSSYYAGITALAYRRALEDYAQGDFVESRYQNELETLKNRGFSDGYLIHRPFEKHNTQNHWTAISEGSYQVNAEVNEEGKSALCRHTIRPNEPKEIVSAHLNRIEVGKNEIGEIFESEGKKYLRLFKILLENGKELESIHSGNENAFVLPFALPPFSFLRQKI